MSTWITAQLDGRWDEATLDTNELLAAHFGEEDERLYDMWCEYGADDRLDVGEFMSSLGYVSAARDNVFNGEQDLSDVYIWEVWVPEGQQHEDWLFATHGVVIINRHKGGDVRGNYGQPEFYRLEETPGGEYAIPVDLCAEVGPIEVRDRDERAGAELHPWDTPFQQYTNGYTRAPWYQFTQDCRIFWHTLNSEEGTVCALHRDSNMLAKVAVGVHVGC